MCVEYLQVQLPLKARELCVLEVSCKHLTSESYHMLHTYIEVM
jgi:hypothetical protein